MRMRKGFVVSLVTALVVGALALPGTTAEPVFSIVRVPVDDPAEAGYLASNFDETHNHGDGEVELLLHPGDVARLEAAGFTYQVVEEDVLARDRAAFANSGPVVSLPGPDRDNYRTLEDYEGEMRALAKKHPDLVKLIKLPHETLEGRQVLGVEVAASVDRKTDGRPYLHVDGLHHAREWPAGEYPMIYAHYLVEGFGKDRKITKLLKGLRVQIVPVVNPDGFDYSRDSLVDAQGPAALPLAILGAEAYWRKNRRSFTGVTTPVIQRNPDAFGVDPNRNYGFFWGDNIGGSSGMQTSQTYRGSEPFSEPETSNVRSLVLSRQVTGMLTNHTYGRLVLRPWGHTSQDAPDEKILTDLGDDIAEAMGGYRSQKGIGLYATTGTTDDWWYSVTGGLGYTLEHETAFHPPYADSVGKNWKGVMDGFMMTAEAAADPRMHSVIEGRIVDRKGRLLSGGKIVLSKRFKTPLWKGNPTGKDSLKESMTSALRIGKDGRFRWHVNPSTRPLIADKGKTESYELTFTAKGLTRTIDVTVDRGEVLDLGNIVLDRVMDAIELVVVEGSTGSVP